jgi:hypothetical protein
MANGEFIAQLRRELPRLLREHPEVRHELWGLMLEAFPSRQEFVALLEELRAFREDSNRQFEAMDRRFATMLAELREYRLYLSVLGGRVERGFDRIMKQIAEEFAGQSFPVTERLTLVDTAGEVYGIAGAEGSI